MDPASLHIETFSVGPLGCNCSLVCDLTAKKAIVVDPGGDFPRIQGRLDALGVTVDAIVHTHTHLDHVGETAALQRRTGAPAQIHEADRFLYDMLPVQAALLGCPVPVKADMEGSLKDGLSLSVGRFSLDVLHTPGHTPGSVCFLVRDATVGCLFAGDTLFRESIGRTDLWGGDSDGILRSIRERLLTLPEETRVVTGHGDDTTIGHERGFNPFLRRRF